MLNPIQVLKTKYKLPIEVPTPTGHTTCLIQVMQEVCEWENSDERFNEIIGELIGATDKLTGWNKKHMSKYVTRYLIQELLVNYRDTRIEHIETTYLRAITKAMHYIENNPWVFTVEDAITEPKLDSQGNVQPAKGDKKVLAKKLWLDNQGKIETRKGWIDLLVKECGMTPAGASTYYHNLKTGIY